VDAPCHTGLLLLPRKKIRVLSLFDGISTGIVALKQLGIEVDYYYASEVDDCAIKCSKCNHPEIIQVGDVKNITEQVSLADDRYSQFACSIIVLGSLCVDKAHLLTESLGNRYYTTRRVEGRR
jgi:site-specific DNA-cytosine methylase